MTLDRRTVWIVVVALVLGWWLGSSPASPVNPHPVPDRPILTALARLTRTAARLGLWLAVAAEPPPATGQERLVQHVYDADGHPIVDHGEGW